MDEVGTPSLLIQGHDGQPYAQSASCTKVIRTCVSLNSILFLGICPKEIIEKKKNSESWKILNVYCRINFNREKKKKTRSQRNG